MTRTRGWLAAMAAVSMLASPADAQPSGRSEHAEVALVFERSAATPGDSLLGAVHFKLADKWHIYWRNPGDSGLPPTVEWASSPQVSAGEFKYPAPYAVPLGPLMNYAYEHEVVLPFDVKISADAKPGDILTIGGKFDYLICADICIPESVTLAAALPVETTVASSEEGGKIILGSLPKLPVALTGQASVERTTDGFKLAVADRAVAEAAKDANEIRFFPNGPELLNAAKQGVHTGADGVSLQLKASEFAKAGEAPLSGVLVVTRTNGSRKAWEITAAPGPAPAGVADKELASAEPVPGASGSNMPKSPEAPPLDSVALLALLGFSFLGGLVLNLMPCVLPVLAIKAAGLVHTAHDARQSRVHGLAYLAGVLVCFAAVGALLVGLKAAGDASVGLGFQFQYAWVVSLFAMLMFAIGLNLLGVFEIGGSLMGVGSRLAEREGTSGAFFTGLLAAFVGAPCVGPFMGPAVGAAATQPPHIVMAIFLLIGLGLAAPFTLLSFTPALAKILPKPGRWMETFRQVLAFPMFATVVWLLWVLDGLSGANGILMVVGGCITLAFGIWLTKKSGSNLAGRLIASLIILAAFVVPAVLTTSVRPTASAPASAQGVEAWSPEKVKQLRAEGRVIFVDFTARWCVTCQFNKPAMHDPAVQKLFSDLKVAFLEADWTNKDSVIAAALAEHGRNGVPLYLVYPADGGEPQVLDQILTVGMIEKAVKDAAGTI